MEDKSSIGIIGIVILLVLAFLVYKFFKILIWLIPLAIVIVVILAFFLVKSSKKTKGSSSDYENQIRDNLSRVRKQIFKAQSNIQRALSSLDLLIGNKYGKMLEQKYTASEFLLNYETVKNSLEQKLENQEFQKFEKVVLAYKSVVEIEQEKIGLLKKTQDEYSGLQKRLKELKSKEKDMQRLDKNLQKIEQSQFETSAEQTLIYTNYTLDDLKNELELKNEYLNQLEEMKVNYTTEVDINQLQQYKKTLSEMKK